MTETTISVCILTYKAREYLRDCLQSLHENTQLSFEVIVVDNGSNDGTVEMLQDEFPDIRLLQNETNEGFTKPMNWALRESKGRYLLLLNPDTIVLPNAIDHLAVFLDKHPEAGICGPKVLNPDKTMQLQCRRGESRPWAVISYFLGLSKLFPKSRFFSQYLVSYLDENGTYPVDGVSGSCMLIRSELLQQIGYLDERFFAYQEDADYCFRARQAGWLVYFVPEAEIIHYGGKGGSKIHPYRSIYEWHHSYYLYYRKNLAKDYFFLFNWLYYLAMLIKLGFAILKQFLGNLITLNTKNP